MPPEPPRTQRRALLLVGLLTGLILVPSLGALGAWSWLRQRRALAEETSRRVTTVRLDATAKLIVVDAITRDGTYKIGTASKSDATLLLTLEEITYRQTSSDRRDTLRSEELNLEVKISWQLVDPKLPGKPLEEGSNSGRTRLFVDDNLQTARANALPDALQRAAQSIVSRIADGF